jgi:uncharacterized membrane protein YedE/YeeE
MQHFTPLPSLIGGVLIGASAAGLLLLTGHIAGITGIAGALVRPGEKDRGWRGLFLAGLVVGGVLFALVRPAAFEVGIQRSTGALAAAGLLVGFGARLGGGCTSGHGVCGIGRLSPRSVVATLTFIATGALATFVVNHLLGGAI